MTQERIVVGVDGTPASAAAVRWAAAAAARRRATVDILLAYHWRVPALLAPRGDLADTARELAELVVADGARDVAVVAPDVEVRTEAVYGHPAEALLRAGADAALLVVGTRGRTQAVGAVAGSVSQQVAAHARCPVAVVRGRPDPSGGVLVGVDDSASAGAALRLGFAEAQRWGDDLIAVRAIETPLSPPALGSPPLLHDTAEATRALAEAATARVAAAAEEFPGVRWECHGVAGEAGDVLSDRSARARLVVVGSRGRGGFTGLLLGSVSLRLLHRAECPVLIARTEPDEDAEPG
ncbi:universal stress protein [Dactylosporangium sp. NPDC000244]|uniref:universal stress protein n=1 Tax=Dactylosporangium sp. NPDC000244 TaxID=3154365 RepID=UPI00333166CF